MPSGVAFEGVTKRFGAAEAVRNLTLAVEAGTRLALLGPSGCGKTTCLRLLAGLETPDAGVIRIGDAAVNDPRSRVAPGRRGIGMVFQSLALWPHMTVQGNLAFVLGRRRDEGKVGRLLDLVGLGNRAKAYPHELSGGEQQRVALARALVRDPQVLLFDEPMANLDRGLKRDLLRSVIEIQERLKVTAIYVTHDQAEAMEVAQTLAVMNAGEVLQEGPPRKVYYEPANEFVARFLGSNNLLDGEVRDGTFRCAAGAFPVEAQAPDGRALAALRAEDLRLVSNPEGPLTVVRCTFQEGRYRVDLAAGASALVAESALPLDPGSRASAEALRPVRVVPGRTA
jgi:iron(III) transport system ATP-binding protein